MTSTLVRSNPKAMMLFFALQLLDVATTIYALHYSGASEANVFLKSFFSVFGPVAGLLIGKSLSVGLIMAFLWTREDRVAQRCLLVTNVLFGGVIIWNLSVIILRSLGRI